MSTTQTEGALTVAPPPSGVSLIDRQCAFIDSALNRDFTRRPNSEIDEQKQDNIRLALTKAEYLFGYDEFANVAYVSAGFDPTTARAIDDAILDKLWLEVDARFGFRPPREFFVTVVMDFARRFSHHPVLDYLDGLSWDGTPRIDTWLTRYAGASDTAFNRAVSALVLIAAVRRVRSPGCKFDELPVLQGRQGDGKSSLIKALVPTVEWFSDSLHLGEDPKQTIERSRGVWIAELSELVGGAREVERIKSFLSRHVDGPVRMAYARLPVRVERQFIAIGSTNQAEFLRDVTGNRRFWPVATTGPIDVAGVRRDRDQLWAEAAAREAAGESIRLAADLWADAAKVQEEFRERHPWEDAIEDRLDLAKQAVMVSALWNAVGICDTSRHDLRYARVLDAVMRRHGFMAKKKIRIRGRKQSVTAWIRDPAVTALDQAEVVTGLDQ